MAAGANRARVPPRLAPLDPPLHPAFPRGPCRWKSPPGRAPWTPRRGPHIRLRYISKLPLLRKGTRPIVPTAAQFPFCRRRSVRSSKYFLAIHLRQFPAEASAGAPGFATPPPPLAWRHFVQRYICPTPPRFRAESCRPTPEALPDRWLAPLRLLL